VRPAPLAQVFGRRELQPSVAVNVQVGVVARPLCGASLAIGAALALAAAYLARR
jgi:hypothetical protein